ncbi:MAG: cupin domain-containing protein [Bryobacterales bacterium]|nr:cupin domain-containing protein [Bryobacterales bacterium]
MPETSDLALLYAMGELRGDERDDFERLLASGDPAATAEVEKVQSIAERLTLAAPAPAIRPNIKDRLMAAARQTKPAGFEQPEPGVHVLRAGNGGWRETGYAGVTFKLLHLDKETGMATSILRLQPGAQYPPHHHTQMEQCLVLSGDVRLGPNIHIFAGDYEKAFPGTDHESLTSETGCELLVLSALTDEIKMVPSANLI